MKLVLTQQETIQAIQYYLANHENMTVDKMDIQYDNFTEVTNQLEQPDGINPWVVPDKDGWFTHNPNWIHEEPPDYIDKNRFVVVELRRFGEDEYSYKPFNYDWSVSDSSLDIIKWKYVD